MASDNVVTTGQWEARSVGADQWEAGTAHLALAGISIMGTDQDNAESKHTNIANTHKHLVCSLQYTMLQWVIDNAAQSPILLTSPVSHAMSELRQQ